MLKIIFGILIVHLKPITKEQSMEERRYLPAVISPAAIAYPLVRVKKESKLKQLWTRTFTIDYHKTILGFLLPVMPLIDNRDLLKIEPLRRGVKHVHLSLVDVWTGKGPFPGMSDIYRQVADSGKELAGIAELSLFAQIMNNENLALPAEDLLVIAPREFVKYGQESRAFSSLSHDEHHGVMLGLTYDWVIQKHHTFVLTVN